MKLVGLAESISRNSEKLNLFQKHATNFIVNGRVYCVGREAYAAYFLLSRHTFSLLLQVFHIDPP